MTETLTPTTEHVHTREALLDAAESLFSEHGIQAASLRAITQRAGANLAAVHYHFGSKEGLVRAVFSRRLKPLNEQRLRLLEACDFTAGDAVEQVLNAFLTPLLRMSRETPEGVQDFARLMGRAYMEPMEEVREMLLEEIGEVVRRFTEAFGRVLPHLPSQELLWRIHFVAGTMGHTVACGRALEKHSHGLCQPSDPDQALRYMIPFLSAGLRAAAAPLAPDTPSQGDTL
jgi:AcrR family transcriptional regulator